MSYVCHIDTDVWKTEVSMNIFSTAIHINVSVICD